MQTASLLGAIFLWSRKDVWHRIHFTLAGKRGNLVVPMDRCRPSPPQSLQLDACWRCLLTCRAEQSTHSQKQHTCEGKGACREALGNENPASPPPGKD